MGVTDLLLLVGFISVGTFSLGVSRASNKSTLVHKTIATSTAKSPRTERTCTTKLHLYSQNYLSHDYLPSYWSR